MEVTLRVRSLQETEELARRLAPNLGAGTVVALRGPLGVGKTTFTRALLRALGVGGRITSPSFNIVKEYMAGDLEIYHMDVYRLEGPEDLGDLDVDRYLYGDGLTVVEWADRVAEALPPEYLSVSMDYDTAGGNPEGRIMVLRGSSALLEGVGRG